MLTSLRLPLFALIACLLHSASLTATEKPNVLIILADDLGFSDIGCYGGEIETPNLDGLAKNGVRFTQFYNTARCWPTRVALLSGFYPQQVGRDALPNLPGGARGRRPAWAQLLPMALRPHGYRSYLSGKWHIDGKPLEEGFDHAYTMDDQNRFFYPRSTTLDGIKQPPVEKNSDYYTTTAIAEHAIDCLKEHANQFSEQPFFHYVAFTCPHFPLHAPASDIAEYRGRYAEGWDLIRQKRFTRIKDMGLVDGTLPALEPEIGPPYRHFSDAAKNELGLKEVDGELPWESLSEEQRKFQAIKMEIHAAMVDRMDQEIGRIIEQVKAMDAYENTLILFLSDNGASAEIMIRGDGHNAQASPGSGQTYLCLGPGWSKAANTPFRRHKTWVHEGGTSTPLIAHWPKRISDAGALRRRLGHVIDIAPTILEVAGASWPQQVAGQDVPPRPGSSFLPALEADEGYAERTLWWLHEGNRAIRKGDLKLVAAEGEPWQLYDCRNDRAESNDLAQGMPEEALRLEKEWNRITSSFEELAKKNR